MPRDTPGPSEEVPRVGPAAEAALARYESLVRRWAPKLDLVAPGDVDRLRERHVADSLRLLPLLEELPAGWAVDVGSGAGFPGVPLAVAHPRHRWRFLEPRRRRAAFLDEVVRDLGLDAEVLPLTAGQAAADPALAQSHVVAAARALAPPADALRLLAPLVVPGGRVAVFVGKAAAIPSGAEEWAPGIAIITVP